jgi:predicted metal-dependent peptidase
MRTPPGQQACRQARAPRVPNDQEQALKQRIQRQCEADRALLMAAQPFTARLLMQLAIVAVVDDRLPTAGTDGESLFVNAKFMARRSEEDRRFILAHEVWHCALGHHRRQLGREPDTWNRACDYEVNSLLRDELGYCPADALYHRRYLGQSAEQIYADLCQHPSRSERGSVLDEHDITTLATLPGQVMDPDFNPKPVTPEGARAWQQRLVATAQQFERQQGSLPGHLQTLVERLRHPQVPWQQVLASFIHQSLGGNRQWLPPARRHVHCGLYLPSQRSQMLTLAVAVDTSGSCQRDLPHFLSELKGILGACGRVSLEVMEFDTRITRRRDLHEGQLHELDRWRCQGGGGSDIRPVFTAMEATPPRLLVALTDGFIQVPSQAPAFPVIWCLTEGGRTPVEWGQVLSLEGGRVRPTMLDDLLV